MAGSHTVANAPAEPRTIRASSHSTVRHRSRQVADGASEIPESSSPGVSSSRACTPSPRRTAGISPTGTSTSAGTHGVDRSMKTMPFQPVLHAEWIKIRTLRSLVGGLCAVPLVTVVFSGLTAAGSHGSDPLFSTFAGVSFGQIAAVAFGATAVSSEFQGGGYG